MNDRLIEKQLLLLLTLLLLLSMPSLIFPGLAVGEEGAKLPYDYSATVECLMSPERPQYNGGMLLHANTQLLLGSSNSTSILPDTPIFLEKDLLYTFSAWVQLKSSTSTNKALVSAVFETETPDVSSSSSKTTITAGWVIAQAGCWSMLKGGITVQSSGTTFLHFHTNDIDHHFLMISSISLQPFTQQQWTNHQQQTIQNTRKTQVRFHLQDSNGNPPQPGTNISIKLTKAAFPFGVAINKNILTNPQYSTWYTSRPFTATTFEDEMKWYATEPTQHHFDYTPADSLFTFARQHGLQVRGHNILWDDPHYQPGWVNNLPPNNLHVAARERVTSLVSKYRGDVISWDVVNENIHFSFFEDKLGHSVSNEFYNLAKGVDKSSTSARLFLNEFDTIEDSHDSRANPAKYIAKLKQTSTYLRIPLNKIGIGLESHFSTHLNLPYMRSSLDLLGATGSPIWITEADVLPCPNQAHLLEQILREAHAHPAVKGIIIWSAWRPSGCYRMCLTDNNFRNLPTGDVVDKLIKEWGMAPEENNQSIVVTADEEGLVDVSLFHGDYEVVVHTIDTTTPIKRRLIRVDVDGCTDMQKQSSNKQSSNEVLLLV